jgi:anti-anti-sigma regulatory factor
MLHVRLARTRFGCHHDHLATGTTRILLTGTLASAAAPAVGEALLTAQHEADLVLVDLRHATVIEEPVVQCLLAAETRAQSAGARFVVIAGSGAIARTVDALDPAGRLCVIDRAAAPDAAIGLSPRPEG